MFSDKSLGFILNDFLDKKKSDNQKDPKCNCGFMSDLVSLWISFLW